MRRRTFMQAVTGAVGAFAGLGLLEGVAAAGAVGVVTDASFEGQITKSHGKVLVYFHAPWNATSRKSLATFTTLAGAHGGIGAFTCDTTAEAPLATKLRIKDYPTTIVYVDGKEIKRHVGAVTNENFAGIVGLTRSDGRRFPPAVAAWLPQRRAIPRRQRRSILRPRPLSVSG